MQMYKLLVCVWAQIHIYICIYIYIWVCVFEGTDIVICLRHLRIFSWRYEKKRILIIIFHNEDHHIWHC